MHPNRRQVLQQGSALLLGITGMNMNAIASAAPSTLKTPSEVSDNLSQAQLCGQGTLRFFGLLVYDVRLWTKPSFQANRYDTQAFALELEYARKLDGPAIAERSIAEMRRIGEFDETRSKAWLALMMQAFPNVAAKDRLTGVHDGKGGVRFFFNGKQTAALTDADFARLFFGIWLAPQTSAPALRASLLNQPAA